jgi:hypothetical protein
MIKINVSIDHHGCLHASPVSVRVSDEIRDRLEELGRPADPWGALLFLQSQDDIDSFLSSLSSVARKDLSEGWSWRGLIDPWAFGQMCGCDW